MKYRIPLKRSDGRGRKWDVADKLMLRRRAKTGLTRGAFGAFTKTKQDFLYAHLDVCNKEA